MSKIAQKGPLCIHVFMEINVNFNSHTSHTSGTSGTSRTTVTSQSEYDSDTAQSDSAQSEVSYIGRRDSQKAHPSATICKLAAVKNHGK